MVSAMDLFLLPSLHEGLPLVLLEAQAAGLPCLFSTEVTEEADLFPERNVRLSHRESAIQWADALQALLKRGRGDRAVRIAKLSAGAFSVEHSVEKLARLYGADRCGLVRERAEWAGEEVRT
jgi:glycosyltransferase involved in cell wall biosynthesis